MDNRKNGPTSEIVTLEPNVHEARRFATAYRKIASLICEGPDRQHYLNLARTLDGTVEKRQSRVSSFEADTNRPRRSGRQ